MIHSNMTETERQLKVGDIIYSNILAYNPWGANCTGVPNLDKYDKTKATFPQERFRYSYDKLAPPCSQWKIVRACSYDTFEAKLIETLYTKMPPKMFICVNPEGHYDRLDDFNVHQPGNSGSMDHDNIFTVVLSDNYLDEEYASMKFMYNVKPSDFKFKGNMEACRDFIQKWKPEPVKTPSSESPLVVKEPVRKYLEEPPRGEPNLFLCEEKLGDHDSILGYLFDQTEYDDSDTKTYRVVTSKNFGWSGARCRLFSVKYTDFEFTGLKNQCLDYMQQQNLSSSKRLCTE